MIAVVLLDERALRWLTSAVASQVRSQVSAGTGVPLEAFEVAQTLVAAVQRQEPTTRRDVVDSLGQVLDAAVMRSLLVTVDQAADLLSVSPRTVERLLVSGDLPSLTVAGSRRIRRADVEAFIDARAVDCRIATSSREVS